MENSTAITDVDRIATLPIDSLQPNPWNRKVFSSEGLGELTASIKVNKILEALVVRPIPNSPDRFEICSGHRRWLAARQAGFKVVPCVIQSLDDSQVQAMNLVANIQREEIRGLEKAAMVKAFMDADNLTQAQVAGRLGKSEEWVTHLLGFLRLSTDVQQRLQGMNLSYGPLQAIVSLPNDEYKAQIARELQDGITKPEHIERRVHQLHNGFKAAMAKRNKKGSAASPQDKAESKNLGTNLPEPQAANEPKKTLPSPRVPQSAADSYGGGALSGQLEVLAPPVPVEPRSEGPELTSTHQLATALKDDLADNYLPAFGRVGGVMRSALDKAWAAPKTHLVKWGLVFAAVSWLWVPALKTIHYALTRLMHVEVNQVINPHTVPTLATAMAAVTEAPKTFTAAMLTQVASPAGLKAELLSGKKVHFTWQGVPGAAGYNFYSARSWEKEYRLENKKLLTDTQALWRSDLGTDDYKFTVTALDAKDHESLYAEPVDVDLR